LDWLAVLALTLGAVALALALVAYIYVVALKRVLAETAVKLERFENEAESALNTLKEAVSETAGKLESLESEVNSLKQRRRRRRATAVSPETQSPQTP
jgi:F0F1-type ATP synthase membrane subunit b/b'